ncbi:uncharacterized protein BXIN_2940 [Babesia sp. Xinjiang]|uniref:uncharacterized protein n=1 Tax=Babesia sp. Xinjiang TaxID=462227 RepID=UPI000A233B93|nr:uncharacterized protein BXIN_2940 [Babesia sp. Xinjiang]ORM39586.1 hypothetical protein BXIN_2940 [Babesia sp. Xinjiang]
MDLYSLSQLLRGPGDTVQTIEVDNEWPHPGISVDLTDSSCPSEISSDDDFLQLPWPPEAPDESTRNTTTEPNGGAAQKQRCSWHFERHFDYMVDRNLRPLEDYMLPQCQIPGGTGIGINAPELAYYSGSSGASLQEALSMLLQSYKLEWKKIFGNFECLENGRINMLQTSIDRDFQHLMDPANIADVPWVGTMVEEVVAPNVSFPSTVTLPSGDTSTYSKSRSSTTDRQSTFSPFHSTTTDDSNSTGSVERTKAPLVSPQRGDSLRGHNMNRSTGSCPGYLRNECEMLAILEKHGCEPFYTFLDQLFVGLEGCRVAARYAQALDLLTGVIRLMPELICLLIGPSVGQKETSGRRPCYFRRLVILVRSFLKYMGMETSVPLTEIYKDASGGRFTPFYLLTGEKELAARHAKAAMTATLLLRLFTLTRFISEKCMGWVRLFLDNANYSKKLIHRLKRFVYLPLFSMKQVHELVIPMAGKFTCTQTCLLDFDYLQWIRWYLYPPPHLYLLRSELLGLLRVCVSTTQLNLCGWYARLNEALKAHNETTTGADHDTTLRLHLFLLVTGMSFFVAPEFLSTCVGNPEYFFGSYSLLLPHVQCALQKVALDGFVEGEVYPFQERVIDLLKVTVDSEILSGKMLGLHCTSPVQPNMLCRILALAWHYVSAPKIGDEESSVTMKLVVENSPDTDDIDNACCGECKNLGLYSACCSIMLLRNVSPVPVRFRLSRSPLHPARCLLTTADELESKVRRNEEFVNHSRIAANDHVFIRGNVSRHSPLEMVCKMDDASSPRKEVTKDTHMSTMDQVFDVPASVKRCTLGCLLRRHAPDQGTPVVDELRWAVVLQCVGTITRFMNKNTDPRSLSKPNAEAVFGSLSPIWRALVELLCSTELSNRLPECEASVGHKVH